MRNFGQLTAKPPYKNYGPPKHFRFIRRGDGERLPFYRSPHYGQTKPERMILDGSKVDEYEADISPGSAVAVGGLLIGALLFMPLAVWPFIIKGFKPELSYGRRVGIGLGISIGLAAVTGVARAALSKKES